MAWTIRFVSTTVQYILICSTYSILNLNPYCLWSVFLLVCPIPGSKFRNNNWHSVKKFSLSPFCAVDTRNFEHFIVQCWYSFDTEDRIQSAQSWLFDCVVKLQSKASVSSSSVFWVNTAWNSCYGDSRWRTNIPVCRVIISYVLVRIPAVTTLTDTRLHSSRSRDLRVVVSNYKCNPL